MRPILYDVGRILLCFPDRRHCEQKGSVHVTALLNFYDEVRQRVPGGK